MNSIEVLSDYLINKAVGSVNDYEKEITINISEFIGVVNFVEFLEKQDNVEKEKKKAAERKAVLNLLKELNEKNAYRLRLNNEAWAGNKTREEFNIVTKEIDDLYYKIKDRI